MCVYTYNFCLRTFSLEVSCSHCHRNRREKVFRFILPHPPLPMKNQRLFHRAREKGLRAIFAMLCVLCTLTQVQRNCTQSLQADAKRGCIQKRKTWFSFSHSLFNKGTNKRRECETDMTVNFSFKTAIVVSHVS